MHSTTRYALAAVAAASLLAGCSKARTVQGLGSPTAEVPLGDPTGGSGGPTGKIDVASCTSCHGSPGFSASGADPLVSVAPPVEPQGATSTVVGAHRAHLVDGTFSRAVECASCHLVPTSAGPHRPASVVSFSRRATTIWNSTAHLTPTYGAGTCAGTYCHGNFKNGGNATMTWASTTPVVCGSCHGVGVDGPGGTHPKGVGTACGSCHPGYTSTSVNLALHMNGQPDFALAEPLGGGTSCGTCHSTILTAMSSGTHTSAHHLGSDVPVDDATTWIAPLSNVGGGAASRSCVNMCHSDHPHDLTSPAVATHEYNVYADASTQTSRAAGTRTSATRAKTDFTSGTGGMCLSCHKNDVDASRPAIGIAAFDASAHDFVTAAGITWQYQLHSGNFDRNCTKCHASAAEGTTPAVSAGGSGTVAVHFSDNVNLLAGNRNPAGFAAGFVCYNCHGSAASPAAGAQGNRSGKDIQTQIAKTSNHPANADAVHADAAEFTNAAFGNALGVAAGPGQRHASCLDCHDAHGAKTGTHAQGTNVAGPPLEGAWGVAFGGSLAAGAVPTSANFTKKTIVAGSDLEATLCFKCHSAFYAATLPTAPSSGSPGYTQTDQAREFNPANLSYHPVLVTAPNPTNDVLNGWTTTSLMTCTDCHESNSTADPNGPHGSSAGFILKGPNTTWSSSVAIQGSTPGPAGMPSGTFCANCHSSTFANSRFPSHTNGSHNVSCMTCHVRIPHGSGHRGLLVSVGTANTAEGQVFTDSAPYVQGARLGIYSYPASGTNWGNSNCGCGSVSAGH
jgi:predicted CxxxxCH...CXXCH cytochrome family protein